jgi:hypothetical protein
MAHVFVLALAAAVYPTLLAGVIAILTRPDPMPKLAAFLVGGMGFSVTAGIAILYVLEQSGDLNAPQQVGSAGADIAAGLASYALALLLRSERDRRLVEWRHRRRPPKEEPSWWRQRLEGGSLMLAFLIGVVLNLPGIWYLAALKDISTGSYGTAGDVLLVLGFNVVMFTLVEVPLVAYVVAPDRARLLVARLNDYLHAHARRIAIVLCVVIGTYLIVKGVLEAT